MNFMRTLRSTRGQNTVEYAVLISMVVLVILVVQYFVRSAFAGRMRSSADQMSQQWVDPTRPYNVGSASQGARTESTTTAGVQSSKASQDEISVQTSHVGSNSPTTANASDFPNL